MRRPARRAWWIAPLLLLVVSGCSAANLPLWGRAEPRDPAAAHPARRLTTEADGVKARLLAEAEGVLKKAEAYKELDGTQAGQLLQILEAAQTLVPKAISEFAKVLEAAARPMGDIDKVIVLDSGSGGNGEGSALNRYASVAPGLVFNLIERFGAMGIDISGLLGKGGVKAEAETAVVTSGPTVGVAKAEAIKK